MENQIQTISMEQAGEVEGGFLIVALALFDLGMIAYDAYKISQL